MTRVTDPTHHGNPSGARALDALRARGAAR